MTEPKSPSDRVDAAKRLTESEVAGVEWSTQELQEARPLRFFVSYAHADRKLKDDLLERLQVHLRNHPVFEFELWTDGEIPLGANWFESIERAMEACDFGMLLVSPQFLSRKFIRDHELPYLLKNRPIIPVAVRKLVVGENADLRGLETRQIFFHQEKSFIEKTTEKTKDDFAIELFDKICVPLKTAPRGLKLPAKLRFPDHFRLSVEDVDLSCYVPSEGIESTLHKGIESAPAIDTKLRKNALDFLTEWLEDSQGPPYCALLGETGMGKTTTCKAFAQNLLNRRDQGHAVPLPIYLDLRHVGGSGKDLVLSEILELILKRSWKGGPQQSKLTADDVIDLVARENALVVWDGLDEVLVHLTDNEGQLFTPAAFPHPSSCAQERTPPRTHADHLPDPLLSDATRPAVALARRRPGQHPGTGLPRAVPTPSVYAWTSPPIHSGDTPERGFGPSYGSDRKRSQPQRDGGAALHSQPDRSTVRGHRTVEG